MLHVSTCTIHVTLYTVSPTWYICMYVQKQKKDGNKWHTALNVLTSLEGRGKRNSRSNRPGRRRAGSIASIRLVAPMTTISPRLSKPSMRARRVDTMEEWIWSCRLERTGARPSISSKKIMEGRIWYAYVCVCVSCQRTLHVCAEVQLLGNLLKIVWGGSEQ